MEANLVNAKVRYDSAKYRSSNFFSREELFCLKSRATLNQWWLTKPKLKHIFTFSTQRQWHDLSYCLALLPYNEKCFKRLQENFACFQDMLMDEKVYACFLQIVSKSKKFVKPEIKVCLVYFIL